MRRPKSTISRCSHSSSPRSAVTAASASASDSQAGSWSSQAPRASVIRTAPIVRQFGHRHRGELRSREALAATRRDANCPRGRVPAVTLRGMDQTSDLIGSSPRRVEDRRLLVGAGRYLDDMTREGLLHLGVVRSPHGHARIRRIDTGQALTLPGVVAAWSAVELPEAARPILAGSEGAHKDRAFAARVLAGDVVRYVGECVAVVVADDPYRLADAIERVAVDYEPLPALITAEEALLSKTRLHADWPDNAAVVARGAVGDAEQALASADVVV